MIYDLWIFSWKIRFYLGVEPKIGGFYPKMDGENFMENPIRIHDLGGFPPIFVEESLDLRNRCSKGVRCGRKKRHQQRRAFAHPRSGRVGLPRFGCFQK